MSAHTLAPSAQTGFADGPSYDAHRPSFPPSSVSTLVNALAVKPGSTILDLAAGTGKFTELLASLPENYSVIAVEPHDGMLATLTAKNLPRTQVLQGFATSIPLADDSVDGVIAAQAFHWFSTLAALKEIQRVLRPGGVFGLIWNVEDYNNSLSHASPHSWTVTLRKYLFGLDKQAPGDAIRFRNSTWQPVFDDPNSPFGPLQTSSERWSVNLDKEALWKRWRTLSQIAALEEGSDEYTQARRVFDNALDQDDVERDQAGNIVVGGITVSFWTKSKQ